MGKVRGGGGFKDYYSSDSVFLKGDWNLCAQCAFFSISFVQDCRVKIWANLKRFLSHMLRKVRFNTAFHYSVPVGYDFL